MMSDSMGYVCVKCKNSDTSKMSATVREYHEYRINEAGDQSKHIQCTDSSVVRRICDQCNGDVEWGMLPTTPDKIMYSVTVEVLDVYYAHIKASSPEEAIKIAESANVREEWEACGGCFNVVPGSFQAAAVDDEGEDDNEEDDQ